VKAYLVRDEGHDHTEIVFADKRSAAILASEALDWNEYINIRATRLPHFDEYAELGYVPKRALLDNGWWLECSGYKEEPKRRCCVQQIIDDMPVVINEKVYCRECAEKMDLI